MKVIKAPEAYNINEGDHIFLGGSIEMDNAEKWQDRFIAAMGDTDVVILNPRRDSWDSTIKQDAYDPYFSEQVNWELNALEDSHLIVFYFDPATKSPITLMELGLMASHTNVIVCCPEGFWRRGNVEVVCIRKGIPMVDTFDELIELVKRIY